MPRSIVVITALLLLHGLAFAQQASLYHKVELYFGLTEQGKKIPEKKWQQFVDEYITPNFPNGMTIMDAKGQWRNEQREITKEKAKVVILIVPNDNNTDSMIQFIRRKYRDLYHQESVLEADMPVEKVRFK